MLSYKQQMGQSTVEYAIVTIAIVSALLTPIPEDEILKNSWLEDYQGQNVISILNDRIKRSYNAYSYAKSLPPLPQGFENSQQGRN